MLCWAETDSYTQAVAPLSLASQTQQARPLGKNRLVPKITGALGRYAWGRPCLRRGGGGGGGVQGSGNGKVEIECRASNLKV